MTRRAKCIRAVTALCACCEVRSHFASATVCAYDHAVGARIWKAASSIGARHTKAVRRTDRPVRRAWLPVHTHGVDAWSANRIVHARRIKFTYRVAVSARNRAVLTAYRATFPVVLAKNASARQVAHVVDAARCSRRARWQRLADRRSACAVPNTEMAQVIRERADKTTDRWRHIRIVHRHIHWHKHVWCSGIRH